MCDIEQEEIIIYILKNNIPAVFIDIICLMVAPILLNFDNLQYMDI